MKFVVKPLLRAFVYLETFIHTRWELVPLEELPEAQKRWGDSGMSPERVQKVINDRDGFLCPDCKTELETTRQEVEELFTDVWDIWKWGRCEQCAADRQHHSRIHHGYLSFLDKGRWMAIFPRVPFLRRVWLTLRG